MKLDDMKPGRHGLIILGEHNTDATPVNIRIVDVDLLHKGKKGINIVYDPVENRNYAVGPEDLFYNREEARKRILRFLSKQHQKFMKGVVGKMKGEAKP